MNATQMRKELFDAVDQVSIRHPIVYVEDEQGEVHEVESIEVDKQEEIIVIHFKKEVADV